MGLPRRLETGSTRDERKFSGDLDGSSGVGGEVDTAPSKEEEGLEFDDLVFEVDPEVILREVGSCGDVLTDEAITLITVAFSKDLDAEDTQEVYEEEVLLEEGHVPPLGGKVKQKRLPIVYKGTDTLFLSSKRTCQQLYDMRRVMSEPLGKLNTVTFNRDKAWGVCGLGTKFSSGRAPEGSLLAIAMPGRSLKPQLITNLNHSAMQLDDKLKAKIENLHKINDTFRDKRKTHFLKRLALYGMCIFEDLTDAREKVKAEMADGKYKGKLEKDVMLEKEEKRHGIFNNAAKRARKDFKSLIQKFENQGRLTFNRDVITAEYLLTPLRRSLKAALEDSTTPSEEDGGFPLTTLDPTLCFPSRYRKYGPPLHQTPGPQTPAAKKRKKSENRKAKQSRRASRRKQEKADENQATLNEAAPTKKATATAKKTPRKKAATKKPTVNGAVAETTTKKTTANETTANEITANETTASKMTEKRINGLPIG
ncbi:hypothetical protein HDU96_007002 [Phlyctochytrium bullatum]|nr:hypothetical protein HDU96_007002 [Phlyctochytrium bullatum]